MKRITLRVTDMKCDGCVSSVKSALDDVAGVQDVEVSLEEKTARLAVEEGIPVERLVDAVKGAGYQATVEV